MTEVPQEIIKAIEALAYVLGLGLALSASIISVGKAIETVRGWRKPKTALTDMVAAHEKRLCAGNERFERQDRINRALEEGQRVTCLGLQALLTSAVCGNNADGIKDARDELNDYLTAPKRV